MNFGIKLVCLLLAMLVAACGESRQPTIDSLTADRTGSSVPKTETVRVTFILKSLTNPFFVAMAKGAREAQMETGIDLQVLAPTPQTSIEQQIRAIEGAIKARSKAIVVTPVDTRRLQPVLKKAQDAGIHIINVDERLEPSAFAENALRLIPFIGVDNEHAAYLAAKVIADQIGAPTEAMIVEGVPGTNTALARGRGIRAAFTENRYIRVVASAPGYWSAEEAYVVTKNMFRSHPNIGVVYCSNDMMAIGVIKYLQENGRKKVLVGGFDAIEESKTAVRAGQMTVTVDQLAAGQGYAAVMSALRLIHGEPVPDVVVLQAQTVTAATVK